jgi:hypothetical protein
VSRCARGGSSTGVGRTDSKFGLYECVNVKLRMWEDSAMRDAWWHPYDETLGRALHSTAQLLYRPAAGSRRLRGRSGVRYAT